MEEDRRKLLTADLAARIPYGVKCKIDILGFAEWNPDYKKKLDAAERVRPSLIQEMIDREDILYAMPCHDRFWFYRFEDHNYGVPVDFIKPYLRPFSSITKKEEKDLIMRMWSTSDGKSRVGEYFDYCNAHHIDYHNMIDIGLALEAPKDMYYFE